MSFDNLVAVFGCSKVTHSMSKIFGFSTVFAFGETIIDCVIGFNKLEILLGCIKAEKFLLNLFGFFNSFRCFWEVFYLFFSKIIHSIL